jgi:hypothetical protein
MDGIINQRVSKPGLSGIMNHDLDARSRDDDGVLIDPDTTN